MGARVKQTEKDVENLNWVPLRYGKAKMSLIEISQMMLKTQCQFLSGIRGESESKEGHGGDEDAGHNQVEKVVQRPSPANP